MTLYLDSSALVKLVVQESESAALSDFLARHRGEARASSALCRTEVVRAAAVQGEDRIPRAWQVVARLDLREVDRAVLDAAALLLVSPLLRSLDAIHLATARTIGPLRAVVTYDHRMREAARALGLPVVSPS